METTGRAEIIYFEASGRALYELANCDARDDMGIEEILHNKIQSYMRIPNEKKEYFINESMPREWTWDNDPDLYTCYQMLKFLWLAEDIGMGNQEAPVQMIQVGRKYNFHPGSDKRIIITYLNPLPMVKGFYIWYPELDNAPWHWTNYHEIVRTPDDFVKLFTRADHDTFNFKYMEGTFKANEYICPDPHFKPWAAGIQLGLKKWNKIKSDSFEKTIPTLSYHDGVHRMGMFQRKELLRSLKFNKDIFHMGRFKFVKVNNKWRWADVVNNYPKSIIDSNFVTDDRTKISFQISQANIGRYRKNM